MDDSITKVVSLKRNKALNIIRYVGITIGLAILGILNCYLPFLLYTMLKKRKNKTLIREEGARDRVIICLVGLSVICAFATIFMFYYGQWKHSIEIGDYIIFSSWELLLIQIFPIGLWVANLNCGGKEKNTVFEKSTATIIILAFGPLLLNAVVVLYDRRVRVFEKNAIVQEILFAFLTAALVEECFFRGFLYNMLKKIMRKRVYAVAVSSLVFALWHIGVLSTLVKEWSWPAFINLIEIFFVGIICAELYEKTGSLFVAILFHACNNNAIVNAVELIKYYRLR